MTTKSAELLSIAQKRLYPNYKPAPIVVARGKGCDLFDVDGRRWLDLAAGVAVCSVGHAHPRLVKALADQAARVMHVSNYFYNEENVLLADALAERSGLARAFFCSSGAEANEAMFKLARRHFFGKGDTKRTRFIAFHNAFHGRTMGAVSLTGTPKYREGFGGVEGVTHVAYGDLDAVKAELGGDVAAVIVEPVQGERAASSPRRPASSRRSALTSERGAFAPPRQVQTGIRSHGSLVRPDRRASGPTRWQRQGLGGGCPIGAMLTTEMRGRTAPPGTHGSTFGENPLRQRRARAVLAILEEEGLVDGARAKGERLGAMLAELARGCRRMRGRARRRPPPRPGAQAKGYRSRHPPERSPTRASCSRPPAGTVIRFTRRSS
ncbi:MAG: aminotransferase class III-fold pyridoxal phosphate-dependent enzyme [Labilithrix sp.]|nr:aminotransferase class III-fold pyridoxal phosphate-dependent enzyme [Labilithrix sp.]